MIKPIKKQVVLETYRNLIGGNISVFCDYFSWLSSYLMAVSVTQKWVCVCNDLRIASHPSTAKTFWTTRWWETANKNLSGHNLSGRFQQYITDTEPPLMYARLHKHKVSKLPWVLSKRDLQRCILIMRVINYSSSSSDIPALKLNKKY